MRTIPRMLLVCSTFALLVPSIAGAQTPSDTANNSNPDPRTRQATTAADDQSQSLPPRVSVTLDPLYLVIPPLLSLRADMVGVPGLSVQGEFRLPGDFSIAADVGWFHLRQTRSDGATVVRNHVDTGLQPRWYPSGGFDNGFYTGIEASLEPAGRTFDSGDKLRSGFDPRTKIGPIVGGKFILESGFTVGGTAGVTTAIPMPDEAPESWFYIGSVPIYRFTTLHIGWSF